MHKIFPLAIALIVITLAGPAVVDWVGGMALDMASQTVTQMEAVK